MLAEAAKLTSADGRRTLVTVPHHCELLLLDERLWSCPSLLPRVLPMHPRPFDCAPEVCALLWASDGTFSASPRHVFSISGCHIAAGGEVDFVPRTWRSRSAGLTLAAARSLRRTGPALSAELWNYKRRGEHGKAFHNTTGVQVTKCAIWQVCDSICGMALYMAWHQMAKFHQKNELF